MALSKEERMVILAMRHSNRSGRAIFNYAMRFDRYKNVENDGEPYTQSEQFYNR